MIETTLPSGATLKITPAAFRHANALNKAIAEAAKGVFVPGSAFDKELSVQGILSDPAAVGVFVNTLLSVATSDKVEAAIFACGEKALYNGVPVTPALFDEPKLGDDARVDYYVICFEIIKANCAPFFGKALSGFRALVPAATPVDQK